MKNLNLSPRKALRLAASASLALVAMVSSAHAQQIVSVSETVTLRTGNDTAGAPLSPGDDDGNITQVSVAGCTPNSNDYNDALAGYPANVIIPDPSWVYPISDTDARWIHSAHNPGAGGDVTNVGSGYPAESVQYAQSFNLPSHMPPDANVVVEMEFAADDLVGSVSFGDASSQTSLPGFPTGGYTVASNLLLNGTAASLGLVPGLNTLFFKQCDTGSHFSGLIYSVTVTVDYCVVEIDLRSGITEGAAGLVLLPVGSDDLNVMQVPLPSGIYSTLAMGGGSAAKRISPNSAWLTNLSDTAGWINPNHQTGSVNGSGRAPTSALYRHDFQLPTIPSNATVLLELEWAADETLYGVSLNADVTQPGGNLAIGGGLAPEFSFASNAQFVGSAGFLGLGQGTNSLYLSQLENYPGTSYSNNPYICSGIMYIAKLTITFPCDGAGDTPYETFCECPISAAPCSNAGGPNQGCANSTGAGSRLTASGVNPSITLTADNLPNPQQTVGVFFRGTSIIGPLTFGDGLRCVGGQVERLKVVITTTGQADHGPIYSPPGSYYQFWYRDNVGPCGQRFNLSSAIAIP